jgi:hypothetical protein
MNALTVLLLLIIAWLLWRAGAQGRALRRRVRVARRAEGEAEELLVREGFTIVERQVHATLRMEIDGRLIEVAARADVLVERDGLLLVAEVKSGCLAPDPTLPATRRQLLEYLVAFEVDGVVLVDMQARRVHEVVFPDLWRDETSPAWGV